MRMPKMDMDWKITPHTFLSAGNFVAIVFFGGMVWASTTGDVATTKKNLAEYRVESQKAVEDLRAQIRQLQTQDTAIAVIKNDVAHVADSVQEVKASVARI